jgi:hypothetical protein
VADVELYDEVVDWMLSLEDAHWDRTVVAIDRLAGLGSAARLAALTQPGRGLFELRFTLGASARPITYRFGKDNRIVLLSTFGRRRNNERGEIARARKWPKTALGATPEGDDDGQLLPLGRRQEATPCTHRRGAWGYRTGSRPGTAHL